MTTTDEAITTLHTDFSERNPPFDQKNQFPEDKLLAELSAETPRQNGFLLTFFCTVDYNRDAFNLVNNILAFYNSQDSVPMNFSDFVQRYTQEDLEEKFDSIGFRYPSRDARGIHHNFSTISNKYGSIPHMIQYVQYSAPNFAEQLTTDELLYLKGAKLTPFYTRLVSNHVKTMDELWKLDIPVDVHIRRLSKSLFENKTEDLSDDEIRTHWREKGNQLDISPAVVDGGLWLIGNNWDSWGEDYWESIN